MLIDCFWLWTQPVDATAWLKHSAGVEYPRVFLGRSFNVLDQHLQGRDWIMGEHYSIADIAIFPWVRNLVGFYGAGELVQFERFGNVQRVLAAFVARPAVQRGLAIPKRD